MQFAAARVCRSILILFCLLVTAFSAAWSAVPEVRLASGPLFGGNGNIHPNLVLSLSVEFPTVGIAYRGDGGSYKRVVEYVGYFNPKKCYLYSGGNRNLSDGYFAISKEADGVTHECGGATFSGNFMNWAASSAIDMMRYALTGGDRILDAPGMTILQRAVLPDSFYASPTYFPRRIVSGSGEGSMPAQVTPFDVTTLYVVSCRNRILFSDKNVGGNCDTPAMDAGGKLLDTDKRLGEYLARIRVCDNAEGATRTDLCQKYATGFKPVGEMQRNADKIRFAAMGYLLDPSATRYGGVLRAPMKYVGAKKYDEPSFTEAVNDRPEWDPLTGVFYANPEGGSDRNSLSANSGVVNYLNKFGRSGLYKGLDPISELYYEGLRYLQGKPPTPEATTGLTEAMKDGFPVIGDWKDPVTAACQKNYIVSIADVNTHWDRYIPGNDRSTYKGGADANDAARGVEAADARTPELDVKRWTRLVGEMEADVSGNYANPAPRAGLAGLQNIDTGSGGHGTHYMAGLAYWANTHDIRLDKRVRVKTFVIDVDEGGNGQIDGNTRSLKPHDSQLYLAAKYGGFEDRNGDGNPFITLAADGKTSIKGSNAEWDNRGNGVPANYFLAGQPKETLGSIRKIFASVTRMSGTMSGVSASAGKVSSDGGFVYQPGFEASTWSGSLKKLKVTLNEEASAAQLAQDPDWDAGEVLTGSTTQSAIPGAAARRIYTAKFTSDGSHATVEFAWNELSVGQQSWLNLSPVDGKPDGLGEKRLDYLRGVRVLESGQTDGIFRRRDRVLGDIVNSNVVHVGPPVGAAQGPDYQKFQAETQGRPKTVYVGANDGMLHAFAATDGKELFAYVPNALISGMNQMTSPDYAHRPYMDGAIQVADARIGNNWKTVLAAGMGGGAQGVFALDVSNPENFRNGLGAIFEFTDNDDPDMGNIAGTPLIAKFRTGGTKGAPAEYRYFVVVPSGFNNYKEDGEGKFDAAAPGVLFLLALDKSPAEKWQPGVNYFKFKTPISAADQPNGLSTPAIVTGADGAVRSVHAGDLQGNLWRFDFSGVAPWVDALGNAPKPLFTATDATGKPQPITIQPKIVFAPGGGYVVLFGTGKFAEDADAAPGNFSTQSFYGIFDSGQGAALPVSRDQLAQRTLKKSSVDGMDALEISGSEFSYGTSEGDRRGWYFDFIDSTKSGERSVTTPLVAYGRLFFNSLIPGTDLCGVGGGRTYVLDVLSGLPASGAVSGFASQVGFMSSPVLFEAGAARVGERNAIGSRIVKKRYSVFNFGTGGANGTAARAPEGSSDAILRAGRFSWREVLNWQELRDALAKGK